LSRLLSVSFPPPPAVIPPFSRLEVSFPLQINLIPPFPLPMCLRRCFPTVQRAVSNFFNFFFLLVLSFRPTCHFSSCLFLETLLSPPSPFVSFWSPFSRPVPPDTEFSSFPSPLFLPFSPMLFRYGFPLITDAGERYYFFFSCPRISSNEASNG